VIDKPGKGAFYQTDLELMLRNRGIDTLFVCGVTTEVCVNTTVREANDRGFRCVVLSDCCASYFPQFHEAGLAIETRLLPQLPAGRLELCLPFPETAGDGLPETFRFTAQELQYLIVIRMDDNQD